MNITRSLKDDRWMVDFLKEAARYFENRPIDGEDKAYWANVYNADNCRLIAAKLEHLLNDT